MLRRLRIGISALLFVLISFFFLGSRFARSARRTAAPSGGGFPNVGEKGAQQALLLGRNGVLRFFIRVISD